MSTAATSLIPRLEKLLGNSQVSSNAATLADYEVDGMKPAAVLCPSSVEEVAAAVRFAAAEKLAVIPTGGHSKLRIGGLPSRYDVALDLTGLNRVVAYDAGDLTVGVQCGVRIAELNRVLGEQKQFVPLATAFASAATAGGVVAANSISALRYAYGSARDFVLGMEIVTGDGIIAKSGGSVVKNVTGYDLHKVLIGSYGTLGVITRINFKTFPLPPTQQTFVATFAGIEGALAFSCAIRQSSLEPRLVELLDAEAWRIVSMAWETAGEAKRPSLSAPGCSVVVSAAGKRSVVERHAKDLARFAETAGAATFIRLDETDEADLLGRIREYISLALKACPAATVLRVNVLPSAIRGTVKRLNEVSQRRGITSACLIRAGAIIYYVLLPKVATDDVSTLATVARELMQSALEEEGSERPMMEWCPTELKTKINIWGSAEEDLQLMQRVKNVFDPIGIMSPGRFLGGL